MTLREHLTRLGVNVDLALIERYDNSHIYGILPFLQMHHRLSQILLFKWVEVLSKKIAALSNSNSEYSDDDYLVQVLHEILRTHGDIEIGG